MYIFLSMASSPTCPPRCPAAGRRGKHLKGFKNFCLKATARIWPRLSYMCHICSKLVSIDSQGQNLARPFK